MQLANCIADIVHAEAISPPKRADSSIETDVRRKAESMGQLVNRDTGHFFDLPQGQLAVHGSLMEPPPRASAAPAPIAGSSPEIIGTVSPAKTIFSLMFMGSFDPCSV